MQHELLLQQIVVHLQQVHGLKAIVLGGSYASGSQRPDSDIDIAIYYQESLAKTEALYHEVSALWEEQKN